MADPGPWASLNLGTPPGGGYGPRSLASGTYGTSAPGPDAYRPARPGSVSGSRYAGGSVGVLPRTRRRSICDSRNPSSPSATAGQPPRSSCMVHAHAKTGLIEPVRHQVRQQPVRGRGPDRTQGGYRTGESSGRHDKGQGGRSPGVVRGREPHGCTTFQFVDMASSRRDRVTAFSRAAGTYADTRLVPGSQAIGRDVCCDASAAAQAAVWALALVRVSAGATAAAGAPVAVLPAPVVVWAAAMAVVPGAAVAAGVAGAAPAAAPLVRVAPWSDAGAAGGPGGQGLRLRRAGMRGRERV